MQQIQVGIIEVADMQALLVVAAAGSLATASVQESISELKCAIEIAIFTGRHWPPAGQQSNLVQKQETE